MKKIINIILTLVIVITLTSCEDFLTITPSNQIVEEEFWEDKNDLQNVVASCYTKMCGMMTNYIQWGECRSDNLVITTGKSWDNMENIMNANLIPTYSEFSWASPYNVINCCNKILAHGGEVVQRDKSFAQGDWEVIQAEVIAIRALMHLYLTRVWRNVPYVTEDYNNDGQDFLIKQSSQQQVLTNIINELEAIKDVAMRDYGQTVWNKGRITRAAVYSILADAYLWRASKNTSADSIAVYGNAYQEDYAKCIECCDTVINIQKRELVDDLNKNGKILGGVTLADIETKDLLIPDEKQSTDKYARYEGAFNYIFGSGNSKESIFELQIDGTNNSNSMATSYFMSLSDKVAATLSATDNLFSDAATNSDDHVGGTPLFSKRDYRRWASIYNESKAEQTTYPIVKYSTRSISQSNGTGNMTDNTASGFKYNAEIRTSSTNSAHWIFYRITDIMLMKAEAITQLTTTVQGSAGITECFNLVTTVFRRSNPSAYSKDGTKALEGSLHEKNFRTPELLEDLVLEERQREFIGEGKRWFDLVRYALRRGNTNAMLKLLGRKYGSNKGAVEAKLATIHSLYSPIQESEIKNNPNLVQNPVWKTNENSKKTDE